MLHISRHFIGSTATFYTRTPLSQHECEAELAPRVCASPTLEQCWDAISCCKDLFSDMRKAHVTGFYFFVYEFTNKENFIKNEVVLDGDKTKEHISFSNEKANLLSCFYVCKNNLKKISFLEAAENATIKEAIDAYEDWQEAELRSIEANY